uniref:Uncharacterized protein n=1 Tax=Arundo donax TaxID=35708 RepID=A0A0A8ZJL9_ARUDO
MIQIQKMPKAVLSFQEGS